MKNQILHFWALIILLVGSSMQFGAYTVSRYFIPLCATILSISIILLINSSINKDQRRSFKIHASFYFAFLIVSCLGNKTPEDFIFDFVKLTLAFSMSGIGYYLASSINSNHTKYSLHFLCISSLLFLSLESIIRFGIFSDSIPVIELLAHNFYLLKINSPFMVDSNAVGLYAIFYLCILIGFNNFLKSINQEFRAYKYYLFFYIIFILLTLSRTAFLTIIIILLINRFSNLKRIKKIFIFLILLITTAILFPFLINSLLSDGSGATKAQVLINLPSLITNVNTINIFFGHGINQGNFTYSYEDGAYSHLLIPMILGQFGIVGIVLYFSFFSFFSYISKSNNNIVLLTAFILGLSYLPPFLETIFLAYGTLAGLYSRIDFRKSLKTCVLTQRLLPRSGRYMSR